MIKFQATPLIAALLLASITAAAQYAVPILPPEHKKITDPQTGAQLTFLTTNPAKDNNLYFHDRSWLADGSVILFTSARDEGGLLGYVVQTGELLRLTTPAGNLCGATAANQGPAFYAIRGRELVYFTLNLQPSPDPAAAPSTATLSERVVCTLPDGISSNTAINESCDSTRLSVGINLSSGLGIGLIHIDTGEFQVLCQAPTPPGYGGHVQWSHTNPNLLSYAALEQRLMIVDIRDGIPKNVYTAWPGELVTHESWWVNDQILFCGSIHPYPTEDAHVKVLNIATGEVRIIGAGAWWPQAKPIELAKYNWWHSDGSDDGRWVAADNWHGDIMLWEAKTTRPRLLTAGHRTYADGDHPHVGFDRANKAVVFTSHLLGNEDVCIAEIPQKWQDENH